MIHADLAEPRLRAFVHVSDIAQVHGYAVAFGDQDALHFGNRAEEAKAADVHALIAHGEVVAADVGVARPNGGEHLRERDVVLQQLARIDFRDVLARAAAE